MIKKKVVMFSRTSAVTLVVSAAFVGLISSSRLAEEGSGSPCYVTDEDGSMDLNKPQVSASALDC